MVTMFLMVTISCSKKANSDQTPTSETTVTDIEGNVYPTTSICNKIWMAKNLNVSKYKNGELIPQVTDPTQWKNLTSGAWCYYNNDPVNGVVYGKLYNWFAVNDPRGLAPVGWHILSNDDRIALVNCLGGGNIAGGKMKEAGTTHWISPNTGATNETGFTALPGGYRLSSGGFGGLGSDGAWRSSTLDNSNEDWTIGMGNSYTDTYGSSNGKRSGYSVRCIQGDQIFPSITTSAVSIITITTANSGGNITIDGGSAVTTRGVCWNTSPYPTIANNKTINGTGTGTFASSITGLTAGTKYYVRAYATNSIGTIYGNQLDFNTKISDLDGNTYNTVTIGEQVWMAENLKTTKYNNGDLIGTSTPITKDISLENMPKYQWANGGNESNVDTYGRLYTWFAVNDNRKVCPAHWHVPTQAEWTTLTDYLGGLSISGGKLKEVGTNHWMSPNTGATNETGFTALPTGYRIFNGIFSDASNTAWWSSSEMGRNSDFVSLCSVIDSRGDAYIEFDNKKLGAPVRCLKD